MRTFTSAITTAIQSPEQRPSTLLTLDLITPVRFVAAKSNLSFGGNTYFAKAIKFAGLEQSHQGTIERITCSFDNVDRSMAAYAQTEDFQNKQLVIRRVYRDILGNSSNFIELFRGLMEQPRDVNRNWLIVKAATGKGLHRTVQRRFFQAMCGHEFGETQCNYDGYANLSSLTASGTATAGDENTLRDTALTQADDYWNFGAIKIVISGYTYYRIVNDFDAAEDTITFDVELPVGVNTGDSYQVWKGCPKNWDACESNQAYGPTSDNTLNYGGFLHIGGEVAEALTQPVGDPVE